MDDYFTYVSTTVRQSTLASLRGGALLRLCGRSTIVYEPMANKVSLVDTSEDKIVGPLSADLALPNRLSGNAWPKP
jgi:hypothetical protein